MRIRPVYVATTIVFCFLPACGKKVLPSNFSPVFRSFEPETSFRDAQCALGKVHSYGVKNRKHMYGEKTRYGTLRLPDGESGCKAVAVALRDYVNEKLANECLDELTGHLDRQKGEPLHGRLYYNHDGMHGEVHVWLFPDETETKIAWSIFLREEPLNK